MMCYWGKGDRQRGRDGYIEEREKDVGEGETNVEKETNMQRKERENGVTFGCDRCR